MDKSLDILARGKRALVKALEIALIIAMVLLVLDVLWGVGTRYISGEQDSRTEELARMLLIWVSLLGGAVAYGAKAHLGVDYLMGKMDAASRKTMSLIVDLTVVGFTVSVLLVGGLSLTEETFRMGQVMMALKNIPKGYVYLAVPVSGFFFLIFAVESIVETLRGEKKKEEE